MGLCLSTHVSIPEDPQYTNTQTLKIQEKDTYGNIARFNTTNFTIPQPLSTYMSRSQINQFDYFISTCVLPGFDPRGMVKNPCLDSLFVIEESSSLFAAIFDGHGKDGLQVVNFSSKFMQDYFKSRINNFLDQPQEMIELMYHECDLALLNSSGIDCSTSGTTAVVIYLNETGLYTASVGNSRAVLASLPKANEEVKQPEGRKSKYRRTIDPARLLSAISITVDQKPNHEEEYERIIKSGGKVQQLTDIHGNKIGPYRI